MNDKIRHEILIKHRRETRMQSVGMLLGVGMTMYIAMSMIDLIKLVGVIEVNQSRIVEVQSAHTGIKHLNEFDMHKQQVSTFVLEVDEHKTKDIAIMKELGLRLDHLEALHDK